MLRSAITLDAWMTLRAAIEALHGYPEQTDLVVRRLEGLNTYWYTFRVGDILDLARYKPDKLDTPLRKAMDLHEGMASDAYQIDRGISANLNHMVRGVLLDGESVLGILEPEPRMAARSTRGGGSAPKASQSSVPKSSPPTSAHIPAGQQQQSQQQSAPPAATPFSAYPRLNAPDNVAAGQEFELVIGLSLEQQAGVAGGGFTLQTSEENFELIVQVMAPGFAAPNGIRRFLHVNRHHPELAEARIKLVAPTDEEGLFLSHLEVEFTFQGNLLARAWREIRVLASGTAPPASPARAEATGLAVPPDVEAPDLQVTINANVEETALEWLFTSPLGVELPKDKISKDLKGKNAQTFALNEIKTVAEKDGTTLIDNLILGIADNISKAMPPEFWTVLDQVWRKRKALTADRAPSLLLVSSETYIPWELASVEEDWIDPQLLDPASPPLLGAQLRVGRWVPPGPKRPRGSQRPALPPAHRIEIDRMALVVGDYYAENGQRPLPLAKEEGKTLALRYDTVPLTATMEELDQLFSDNLSKGGKTVEVNSLHFACHGEVDPDNHRYNGIVLSDNTVRFEPMMVSNSQLCKKQEPFVFLNACQLGFSSETLADYGGMAGAFLGAGSRGFLAPLWSIDDQLAHDIAIDFYKRTVDEEVAVGEVMREIRSKFDLREKIPASTFVAYIFYGHPNLMLRRASSAATGG